MLTDSSDIQDLEALPLGLLILPSKPVAAKCFGDHPYLVLHQAFHPVWWQDCPILPPDSYHRGSQESKPIISGSDAAGQSCHRDGYAVLRPTATVHRSGASQENCVIEQNFWLKRGETLDARKKSKTLKHGT